MNRRQLITYHFSNRSSILLGFTNWHEIFETIQLVNFESLHFLQGIHGCMWVYAYNFRRSNSHKTNYVRKGICVYFWYTSNNIIIKSFELRCQWQNITVSIAQQAKDTCSAEMKMRHKHMQTKIKNSTKFALKTQNKRRNFAKGPPGHCANHCVGQTEIFSSCS